ncbi:MAG TPA: VRR-NUC domain-containing protein [Blastocatellia bacterium]|nr:VRR-NUC domain-containing protein [Blastocatellia bacterium]
MNGKRSNLVNERISISAYRALQGRPVAAESQRRIGAAEYQKTAAEAGIQAAITEWLTVRHIPFSVTDSSRAFGPDGEPRKSKCRAGWPDVSGTLPPSGRAFYIETKSAKGRLRAEQKRVISRLRSAGALVIVARDLSDVITALTTGREG